MKNLLSILLVSIILMGCSDYRPENGVLHDELTNKGSEDSPLMYSADGLFTGVGFDVYPDGQLKSQENYKDGERDGLWKRWYEDGQIEYEENYKDGNRID